MFFKSLSPLIIFLCCFSVFSHAQDSAKQDTLNENLETSRQVLDMGKNSQQRVDELATETNRLLKEYQALLEKTEYQKAYNSELSVLRKEQAQEIISLKQQIKDIIITRQRLLPLLREMVNTLHQFIKLDLPFKQQQRLSSITKLKEMIASSSVPISEKYRRVMEMYQAENDYNYSLGAYREKVSFNGKMLSVQVLRVGRSHLYFQTMDGDISAMWDKKGKQWKQLDDRFNLEIRQAMRVASKKSAPKLLELPYPLSLSGMQTEKGRTP